MIKMAHDFKRYPELTNNQMNLYYFQSPHKQITEDFDAKVVKVHDGDTIRVSVGWRDFDFPLRISNIMAAELNEEGGMRSRNHLRDLIENRIVEIVLDKNRVEKWGRLLGQINHKGFDIGEQMISDGFAVGVWKEQLGIKPLMIMDVI